MSTALDLARTALLTTLKTALPVLGTGVVIGLSISLLQTLTQLQDQTLSLVPKIMAMVLAAIFFMPWLATRLVQFSQQMFANF
jgi:flagellar biosynthetic protein FliQ